MKLTSTDIQEKIEAVQDIAKDPDERSVAKLVKYINHDSVAVRINIINALARIGDSSAVEYLASMTGDPHPAVRRIALQSLGRFDTESSKKAVDRALDSEDPLIRNAAARSMKKIAGSDDLSSFIEKAYEDPSMDLLMLIKENYDPDEITEQSRKKLEKLIRSLERSDDEYLKDILMELKEKIDEKK